MCYLYVFLRPHRWISWIVFYFLSLGHEDTSLAYFEWCTASFFFCYLRSLNSLAFVTVQHVSLPGLGNGTNRTHTHTSTRTHTHTTNIHSHTHTHTSAQTDTHTSSHRRPPQHKPDPPTLPPSLGPAPGLPAPAVANGAPFVLPPPAPAPGCSLVAPLPAPGWSGAAGPTASLFCRACSNGLASSTAASSRLGSLFMTSGWGINTHPWACAETWLGGGGRGARISVGGR